MFLPRKILEEKLLRMLAEDVGEGDVTTTLTVPLGVYAEAVVVAKGPGVAAGIDEAGILLESVGLEAKAQIRDGQKVKPKQVLMRVQGEASTILSTERTLLNVLSRMSGIATATRKLVGTVRHAGLKTKVACTRKTAPGLLYFDKKAVLMGGGDTHRLHLDDMVLIKDNHVRVAGSLEEAIRKAKATVSISKKIEVEVTSVEEALTAAKASVDIIMFDNFSPKQIAKACDALKQAKLLGKVLLEASGGITSENVLAFASTGVDVISLGEITQSTRALDMSLEIVKTSRKQFRS